MWGYDVMRQSYLAVFEIGKLLKSLQEHNMHIAIILQLQTVQLLCHGELSNIPQSSFHNKKLKLSLKCWPTAITVSTLNVSANDCQANIL